MTKSYYTILGIPSNAGLEEIKSAYRKLAKAYHPDCESGDSRKFKEIHEAYSVLKDTEKRRQYERQRTEWPQQVRVSRASPRGNRPNPSPFGGAGPEPLIPQQQSVSGRRRRRGAGAMSFESKSPDEFFDWILRHFF
ncbi:MAG: J domain-containing protein [Thermodesulfobacteriota bacterium]